MLPVRASRLKLVHTTTTVMVTLMTTVMTMITVMNTHTDMITTTTIVMLKGNTITMASLIRSISMIMGRRSLAVIWSELGCDLKASPGSASLNHARVMQIWTVVLAAENDYGLTFKRLLLLSEAPCMGA